MTTPQPPIVPGPDDEAYSLSDVMPAAQLQRSKGRGLIVGLGVAVAAVVLVGVGAVAAVGLVGGDGEPTAAAGPSPSTSPACADFAVDAATGAVVCGGAAAVVNEQPSYATPTARDFKVTVKILEKQCFGSAGCHVTYRIDPTYTGAPLDPSVTWLVTYEVRGVEDGPQINTFEVTGDEASFDSEESASTTSSKAKLTVKVTEVLRG